MIEAADLIERYVSVGQVRFKIEPQWSDAVVRQLTVLGEAAKRVSTDTRERHPDVEWKRVAGLRDVLVHQYMSVDLDLVWSLATIEVPKLRRWLVEIERGLRDSRTNDD